MLSNKTIFFLFCDHEKVNCGQNKLEKTPLDASWQGVHCLLQTHLHNGTKRSLCVVRDCWWSTPKCCPLILFIYFQRFDWNLFRRTDCCTSGFVCKKGNWIRMVPCDTHLRFNIMAPQWPKHIQNCFRPSTYLPSTRLLLQFSAAKRFTSGQLILHLQVTRTEHSTEDPSWKISNPRGLFLINAPNIFLHNR